jgi:hypothetical protein
MEDGMKKKVLIVALSLLFLLGCGKQKIDVSTESKPLPTDTPEKLPMLTINAEENNANGIKPSQIETEEPSSSEEHPAFAFTQDMVEPYAEQTGETVFPVTVNTREKRDGVWTYTYRNITVDCSGLRLEVLSFDPYSETEALKLCVTLPETWDEKTCEWARREGIHLRFEVDGKPVDAFRERVITVQNKNEFEVLYRKCILDEYALSCKLFSVRPYLSEWDSVAVSRNVEYHSLKTGEAYTCMPMQTNYIADAKINLGGHLIKRHYPDGCAVSIRMHGENDPALTTPRILRPVTVLYLNYDAIKELSEGEVIPNGTVFLREEDFGKAAFVLDEFHIWEDEVKIVFTFQMPDDWDAEECKGLYRNLYFYAYSGDSTTDDRNRRMDDSPFGRRQMIPGVHTDAYVMLYEPPKEHVSELNYMEFECVFTREQWEAVKELTITPFYFYYTEIDGEPIPPEGTVVNDSYGCDLKTVWLDELAIHIPITEDLFDSGF